MVSAVETKDLSYYLDGHMDELPEDPAIVQQLTDHAINLAAERQSKEQDIFEVSGANEVRAAEATAKEEAAKAADVAKEPEPKADDEAKAKEGDAAKAAAELPKPKIDGVITKDGKNFLPFGVLESTRARAAELEALVVSQSEQIAALGEQINAAKEGKPSAAVDIEMVGQEQIEALRAEGLDTFADILDRQNKSMAALASRFDALTKGGGDDPDAKEADAARNAVDAVPELAQWEAAGGKEWDRARKFDDELKIDPEWKDKPLVDRFQRVVALTQAYYGHQETKVKQPADRPADLAAQAAAKLESASPAPMPTSLSHVPGGAPAPTDEQARLDSMSPTQLGAMFTRMAQKGGADAIQDYLRTL